jgi:hypothetical protein
MDNTATTTEVALDFKYGIDEWTPETKEKMGEIFNILLLHATHLNVEAIRYDHGTHKKEVALIDAKNCMDYCEWFKENIIDHL